MRMWMVAPRIMCRQHLLGEHVELHMLAAHLRAGKSIVGFIVHNCVQPCAIVARHAALVREMQRRGYRHSSPLRTVAGCQRYATVRINRKAARALLLARCPACAQLAMPRTITRDQLARLAFCNARRMPQVVNDNGRRKRWVGIGWVDEGAAQRWLMRVVA